MQRLGCRGAAISSPPLELTRSLSQDCRFALTPLFWEQYPVIVAAEFNWHDEAPSIKGMLLVTWILGLCPFCKAEETEKKKLQITVDPGRQM